MRLLLLTVLLPACAATQEIRSMQRELSVQIGRLEETVGREARKTREEATRAGTDARKAVDEVRDALAKARASFDKEIAALRTKVGELFEAIAELKKGARVASASSLADLEVRAVGENHYRVSRRQLTERSYELSRLLTQVSVAPYFVADKRAGLRIVEVNGFLERFGILPGDVAVKINGIELTAAEQLRDVFRTVRDGPEVLIEILRGGQKLIYRVTVGE
jgi:type II secretory pathway component PulC